MVIGVAPQSTSNCRDIGQSVPSVIAGYTCALKLLPSFWQMRRMIVFPEVALWAREPIAVAHIPTK
jgi:hypothetical protein